MVDATANGISFSRNREVGTRRDHGVSLNALGTRRRSFQDVRDPGFAPNPRTLDGRQLEVAQLVAPGLADKEIAHYLAVNQGTVKAPVSTILRLPPPCWPAR